MRIQNTFIISQYISKSRHYVKLKFIQAIDKMDNYTETPNQEDDISNKSEKVFQTELKVSNEIL